MKVTGIIAEYNPFHKGHAYQLQKAKELTKADYTVIVMSGNFVQRGLPALLDKYTRAEMALANGADLVLELPVPYATGSAEAFARGAVSLLNSLGCVDSLCFGSESGDLQELLPFARLFDEEPEGYRQLLKAHLKNGYSYPAARSRAAEEYLHHTDHIFPCSMEDSDCCCEASLLSSPNNILGMEYCRALLHTKSSIQPVTVKRLSSGYHDLSMDTDMSSATAIREALGKEGFSKTVQIQLPKTSAEILETAFTENRFVRFDDFSSVLFYRLLSLKREELASFLDITEDLAARMDNYRYQFTSASAFADLLKTKQLTHTRITRALCHILLDLRQEDFECLKEADYPVYANVLGFQRNAAPLLRAIKETGTLPLLTKPADAREILTTTQYSLFEKDAHASHVYEMASAARSGKPFRHAYTRSPVILS